MGTAAAGRLGAYFILWVALAGLVSYIHPVLGQIVLVSGVIWIVAYILYLYVRLRNLVKTHPDMRWRFF